jgi:histidyl-tRNA synthetase
VLDDKRPEVRALLADAPLLRDHLSPESAAHHAAVLAHLDDLGVPYVENPRMVRGLDYYTKTTFEFVHDGLGAQSGVGGGGRYDGLMATLGGPPLSGVGYGIGVDRALLACRAEGVAPWNAARVEVFGVPLGDAARSRLLVLAAALRRAGVRADLAFGGRGLKGAMKAADRSGARYALVLGERDLAAGEVGLKDLASGEQVAVALDDVVDAVVAALARPPGDGPATTS